MSPRRLKKTQGRPGQFLEEHIDAMGRLYPLCTIQLCIGYTCEMSSPNPRALSDEQALRLDNQLCFALYSASLTMTKLYKPVLERLGLTYPQYLVMLVLWESSPLTVSELGARLFLDSGTLTPLLKRLQAAGWLLRERDATDERRVLISPSDAGRALRRKAAKVPREMAAATGCSVAALADLTRRLQTLRRHMAAIPLSPSDLAA